MDRINVIHCVSSIPCVAVTKQFRVHCRLQGEEMKWLLTKVEVHL